MEKLLRGLYIGGIMVLLAFIFALILALPIMWLWNWFMPVIFGLTKITFWQAFGLNLLSSLLIRSTNIPYDN